MKNKSSIKISRLAIILLFYLGVILISTLHSRLAVSFSAPHYMTFILGVVILCAWLYFSEGFEHLHSVLIYLFLLMLLFYPQESWIFTGLILILLPLFAAVVFRLRLPLWGKLICLAAGALAAALSLLEHRSFIFITGAVLLTGQMFSSAYPRRRKWDILIVDLLFLMAILGSVYPAQGITADMGREYMIFTIPVSLLTYLLIVNSRRIADSLYLLLIPHTALFLAAEMILALFGICTVFYRFGYSGSYYRLAIGIMLILLLWYIYTRLAAALTEKNIAGLKAGMDDWFREKWELALSDQQQFSWSGFESLVAALLSNDGLEVSHNGAVLFAGGCFSAGRQPRSRKQINVAGTVLCLHETAVHQPFRIHDLHLAFALCKYLDEKLCQWEVLQTLRIDRGDGSFAKELQFRKDVTYYLHDNVLQNIIAAKNIVSALTTEKKALQGLAVETLTELNDSIRSQMHEIYPSTLLDLPFERNIHILIDELRKKYGRIPQVQIDYCLTGKIDEEYSYFLYRSLQELLNNTCKHAGAENITIMMKGDAELTLTLTNDGRELPTDISAARIKHLGLSSIRHQAAAFNGRFEIIPNHSGVSFVITLPRRPYENTLV